MCVCTYTWGMNMYTIEKPYTYISIIMRRVYVKPTLSHACINNHHHTDYKHRVYALSANPFHHSSVIGAVSGNNEVSMWDMETATRRHMLWASSLPPFSKMTDDVSNICVKLYTLYFLRALYFMAYNSKMILILVVYISLFSLNRSIQYAACVLVLLMRIWSC